LIFAAAFWLPALPCLLLNDVWDPWWRASVDGADRDLAAVSFFRGASFRRASCTRFIRSVVRWMNSGANLSRTLLFGRIHAPPLQQL
jgi:hypothetical protein